MLNETYYWSIPFGKWNGTPIRLHMLLFLVAAVIFGIEFHLIDQRPALLGTAFATVLVGAVVIGIHVAAQMTILRRYRGSIKTICVVPWGAIYHLDDTVPLPVRTQGLGLGILSNVLALSIGLLILMPGSTEGLVELLHPFQPRLFDWQHPDRSLVEIFAWLNFALLLSTLIPIVPFDLGYLLENWAERRLPDVDPLQRHTMHFAVGQLFALSLFFVAYFVRDWTEGPLRPAWLWPAMMGIVLFFAARQHFLRRKQSMLPRRPVSWPQQDARLQAFFAAERHPSEERSLAESWSDLDDVDQWDEWMKDHQESRYEAIQEQEQTEDALLDKILHKVGLSGMASLTEEERELLHRVSQRYRNRRPTEPSS